MKNFCKNYLGGIFIALILLGIICAIIGCFMLKTDNSLSYCLIGAGMTPMLIMFILMILSSCINHRFFCDAFGWHKAPKEQSWNGLNASGKCPVCGEDVMQDSQGNWF